MLLVNPNAKLKKSQEAQTKLNNTRILAIKSSKTVEKPENKMIEHTNRVIKGGMFSTGGAKLHMLDVYVMMVAVRRRRCSFRRRFLVQFRYSSIGQMKFLIALAVKQ